MSIDYLLDLERDLERGKPVYACPGPGARQWMVAKSIDDIRRLARRVADGSRSPVGVMRLLQPHEAATGELFLVPMQVDPPGARGEAKLHWRPVGSREAAEELRDVRYGPVPYFCLRFEESVPPSAAG